LCHAKNRFLFEVRPDVFPEGMLTQVETELWSMFFAEREEKRKRGQ